MLIPLKYKVRSTKTNKIGLVKNSSKFFKVAEFTKFIFDQLFAYLTLKCPDDCILELTFCKEAHEKVTTM